MARATMADVVAERDAARAEVQALRDKLVRVETTLGVIRALVQNAPEVTDAADQ